MQNLIAENELCKNSKTILPEQKPNVSSWRMMEALQWKTNQKSKGKKILEKYLKRKIAEEKKKIADLQKQNKTKARVEKTIEEKTAQLAKMKERTAGLENALNSTQTLDDLNQQEIELKEKIEQDRAITEDPDTSPSEKEAARERVAEREEEIARLQTQITKKEGALPLRERVKEIFKKYGVTVTAIVLAAGMTIGAVVGAISISLKALGKGLANGLKTIGQKTAWLLPGLLGSIVSYIFTTAAQVIGFLAKHTWLMILAVAAFLIERYVKRR